MIFRSNLVAPDLSKYFKLLVKERGHSFHHDCPSDPDFDPDCTSWTHDEAAILYTVAFIMGGDWLDLGCRFGWTSAHIAAAGGKVTCVDPMLKLQAQQSRFELNMEPWFEGVLLVSHFTAEQFLHIGREMKNAGQYSHDLYDGFVIDGCHDAPEPLNDAMGCAKLAKPTAVIMLHDFWGQPVRDAVTWLLDNGWKARVYWTPNGVACCWKGEFEPPVHHGDARIFLAMSGGRFPDFNFARLS